MQDRDAKVQVDRWISVCVLCIACMILCVAGRDILGRGHGGDPQSASRSAECLGTVISMTLYGADEDELNSIIEEAFDNCSRMEEVFSARREDSELARLNETRDMQVSDELRDMIRYGIEYGELTQGALDIGLGQLTEMWGIGTDDAKVPRREDIIALLPNGGYKKISIEGNGITINDDSVMIDLGAIAKGYAAQKIKEQILAKDRNIFGILDFGGNIVTLGSKRGVPWTVGIIDPASPDRVGLSVNVTDMSVVTSGNYERYFELEGIRYHHILDPETGYPADKGVVSASIIGPDSWQCDALSTACYILGTEKALELIEGLVDVEVVLIDAKGNITSSSGIGKYEMKIR